jgi:hypothetical protein
MMLLCPACGGPTVLDRDAETLTPNTSEWVPCPTVFCMACEYAVPFAELADNLKAVYEEGSCPDALATTNPNWMPTFWTRPN